MIKHSRFLLRAVIFNLNHTRSRAEVSKVVIMTTKKVQTFAALFAGDLLAVEQNKNRS